VANDVERALRSLGEEFMDKQVPEWNDLIARVVERG
jgi:hypothetical protein